MYCDALLLDTYTLRIVMSPWITDPFITMQRLSLYLIFLALNLLSEINTATLAFFGVVLACYVFLRPFTFNLYVSLYLKLAFCI